jgi:signal transduction histidine kinase
VRRDRLYLWTSAHPLAVDVLTAALLVLLVAVPTGALGARAQGLSVLLLAPLALRRTRPVLTAALVFSAAAVQWAVSLVDRDVVLLVADVGVLVALYDVAGRGPRRASRLALATALLGALMLGVAVVGPPQPLYDLGTTMGVAVAAGGLALAAWTLGDLRRVRLAHVASLEERAERLERERAQQAELAAAAERARIAREMHDVVAHSLSVVIAQADGGRYAVASSPAAAQVLETIAATGRTALADMRRLLGVLREPSTAPTAPQPHVDTVRELVDGVRRSGLPVSLVDVGERRPVPAAYGLAAFRIVQEGLTNVLKHAGPGTPTTVALRWTDEALELQVDDDGTATPVPDGAGHGLTGMRERARLFGGEVAAGPRPEGGHRLLVRLPYP